MDDLWINDLIQIPKSELTFKAVRSSGAGGQNVNKVATKVELRFDLEATAALSEPVKNRLRQIAKSYWVSDDTLVIVSQSTRSQLANLEDARAKLAELVRASLKPPKRRQKTRPTKSSKERRLKDKKSHSDTKKSRGKVEY